MYYGFNEDEAHRRVFDGIMPTIAGTLRVFINARFADPNVFASQDVTPDYLQNSYPPFTYGVTTDTASGIRDGILTRPATDPHVFQIDSASEFWQLRASLNTVDGEGRTVPVPANVRLYFVSSTGHGFTTGGLTLPPPGRLDRCENPTPSGTGDAQRALLVAMDAWVDKGVEPPASNYPRVEDGTLVPPASLRAAFPQIPGVTVPPAANNLDLLDYGSAFGRHGGMSRGAAAAQRARLSDPRAEAGRRRPRPRRHPSDAGPRPAGHVNRLERSDAGVPRTGPLWV